MANSTQGFGFRAVNRQGGVYNGAFLRAQIPTTASEGALFIGDVVTLIGGASTDGYPTVKEAAATEAAYGVVASFDANPDNLSLPYRAASTQRYVNLVPVTGNFFEARFNGSALSGANVGQNTIFAVGGGSTVTGQSTSMLSATDVGTSVADEIKIISFKDSPDNDLTLANAVAIVQFNEPALGHGPVGV